MRQYSRPNWPARMRAADAAWFVGDSLSTFRQKVSDGHYPRHDWQSGTIKYWDPEKLWLAVEATRLDESDASAPPAPIREIDRIRAARQ